MKSKLKIIIPLVVLLILGGVYKVVLVKPPVKEEKKIDGLVYVLPKEFVVNLKGGRYGKFNVALVLHHGQPTAPAAEGHAAAEPPEGYGTLEQEAIIRSLVVDQVTAVSASELANRERREKLKRKILKQIKKHSDVKAEEVLITDVALQ